MISSAALVSSYHLFGNNRDFVRRWINEVQEALNSRHPMVQYHALGLIYQLRQNDRMALNKIVQTLTKGQLRSPYASCMLIRYAQKIMEEEGVETYVKKPTYIYI
jgi:coatomer protein complex subunit gamma